jgi:hypothetical protein
MTLDDALEGKAKSWRDFVILNEPGRSVHQATMVAGAIDEDYGNYYRYIRAEMFKRANVHLEDPGEASRKRWENIRIPNHFRFQEDLDEVIETIVEVYTQMSKRGMILPGLEDDERKMVQDLSNKVERGTDFRMWFYGTDGYQDIRTVRGWVDRAQKYRSLLAHRRKTQPSRPLRSASGVTTSTNSRDRRPRTTKGLMSWTRSLED